MNYVIAVSGGVDSVVLLDMMAQRQSANDRYVVVHFDHGIRSDSAADARFVEALAQTYGLPYVSRHETLGKKASEATARARRYAFLRDVAKTHDAKIVTAHHQDDLIETIAINLTRGTGWRGLAVFGDKSIVRPLVHTTKHTLLGYAAKHNLEWVEDETNRSDAYLRNRLRASSVHQLAVEQRRAVLTLWGEQKLLRRYITKEETRFVHESSRYFFIMIDENVAIEILRARTAAALTRPQLIRLLHAIKTARAGTMHPLGASVVVHIAQADFHIENTPSRCYNKESIKSATL